MCQRSSTCHCMVNEVCFWFMVLFIWVRETNMGFGRMLNLCFGYLCCTLFLLGAIIFVCFGSTVCFICISYQVTLVNKQTCHQRQQVSKCMNSSHVKLEFEKERIIQNIYSSMCFLCKICN